MRLVLFPCCLWVTAYAVATVFGAPAEAQSTATPVRNLGQTAVDDSAATDRAQTFATGTHAAGHDLSGVEIAYNDGAGGSFPAAIRTVDMDGLPDALVDSLGARDTCAAGTLTFTASGDVPLDANTTYAAMMDSGAIAITWTTEGRRVAYRLRL